MYLDQAYYIEPAIDSVRNVWKELNLKTPTELAEPGVRERDDFEHWRKQIYHSRSNQDEFECFVNASYSVIFLLLYIHGLTFSLIKIKAEPVSIGSSNTLTWWLQESQQKSFPSLSKLAINIFAIPPMSMEPEPYFPVPGRNWDLFLQKSSFILFSNNVSPVLETGSHQLDVKVSALWKVILRS